MGLTPLSGRWLTLTCSSSFLLWRLPHQQKEHRAILPVAEVGPARPEVGPPLLLRVESVELLKGARNGENESELEMTDEGGHIGKGSLPRLGVSSGPAPQGLGAPDHLLVQAGSLPCPSARSGSS